MEATLTKATTTPAKIMAAANLKVGSFFMMVIHGETEICPHSCRVAKNLAGNISGETVTDKKDSRHRAV
jgi:hypothetical protein